jgi:hypothetical protein
MPHLSTWVRPLYLYLACLVSLIVFIIGTTTIGHELMRRYIFGLKTDYYENPARSCEYIFTQEKLPPEYVYDGRPIAKPVLEANEGEDLTDEEREERYERCVENREVEIEEQSKYQLASKMSNGLTMILVSVPLFWLHWRIVSREKKA